VLFHVYGGEISSDVWQDRSKEMLKAADKYGLSNLKNEMDNSILFIIYDGLRLIFLMV